jgi:hypothetical protein
MHHSELPEHVLEFVARRAFNKCDRIDCVSIAQELLPSGAHPDHWSAAKRLGLHLLNHMAERRIVWKDDEGFWREVRK